MLDRILDYIEREPARAVGHFAWIAGAVIGLLVALGVISTTAGAAATVALGAVTKFLNDAVRETVMPMSKVAKLVQAPVIDNGDRDATPPPAPPSNPPEAA